MLNIDLLQQLLVIAIASSVIAVAFIQKTKGMCKNSKCINTYSFIVNMILGILFCLTFTEIDMINSLWVGVFSYIGADTLYKSLEGKLRPFSEIINKKTLEIIPRGDE